MNLPQSLVPEDPQGLKEKVAEGRMRGRINFLSLTLALLGPRGFSLRARGVSVAVAKIIFK